MSKTKFNGFEKWFLTTAIEHAVEEAEDQVEEAEKEGKHLIYAKGYFSTVGKDLIEKVHGMTLKKDQ
jgi:UDP-2,3-diacylglucosamine pyrophosphatase LpxH